MFARSLLALAALLAATRPLGAAVPGLDALGAAPPAAARAATPDRDPATGARIAHREERLGVPTFVWTAPRPGPRPPLARGRAAAEGEARRVLAEHAALWRLSAADLARVELKELHDTGRGPVIARFRSTVDGVEVFREGIQVAMERDLTPIAISGLLAPASELPRAGGFRLDRREAVAIAVRDLTGEALDAGDLVATGTDAPYEHLEWRPAAASSLFLEDVRVKRVLFQLPGTLVPGWYVEARTGKRDRADADYVAWVVSAVDGSLLFRHDLTAADSFSYRVWADATGLKAPHDSPAGNGGTPHPTGMTDGWQAPFVAPNLVTLEKGPIATNDPWLPAGSTQTNGNNADAYADLNAPDGIGGDVRATTTAPGVFDRTYDTSQGPGASQDQRFAVVTQLFYDVNFFHDWYYGSGFDEASGNAQASNYGRGGKQNDSLRAEAQDYSGLNNANMSTPADGGRPRMQMYVFEGDVPRKVTVNAPASIAGVLSSSYAQFGAQRVNVTAEAVLVNNAGIHDGCSNLDNASALAGKIALVDRGTCTFVDKVKRAQAAGAVGVVIMNNAAGMITMAGDDPAVTIGALSVSQADGARLKAASGLNLTLQREPVLDLDGGLDNGIIAHEWGHYISNRLVYDAVGLSTQMAGGLGEGWSDFHALLLSVKGEDAALPGNAGFSGVYAFAGYVSSGQGDKYAPTQGYYFGFRRMPYSTDLTKNGLTFKHIANGVPLPSGVPTLFGASGASNAEVHNSGEVWCAMLWEAYAALLNDTSRLTFEQARDRMKDILVASYKLTPANPTLLEARDALLATARGFDPRDYVLMARAFAKRGAGTRAVAPDRYASDNKPVVESFTADGDMALVSAALDDAVASCDVDGILDAQETGRLTLVLKNVGTESLNATSLTLAPTTAGLSNAGPAVVAVPPTEPLQTATVTLPVRLASGTGILALALSAEVNDPGMPQALTIPISLRGNVDDVPAQSATDDVESDRPAWTAAANWKRLEVGTLDHRWRGVDPGAAGTWPLTSPALEVTGALQITFRHRYQFPTYVDSEGAILYIDGGVIEASTNGGTSWSDVRSLVGSIAYDGQIVSGTGNPLSSRNAFAGTSPGWPNLRTTTLDFGSALAGKSLRLRFLIGSGNWEATSGWEIDDIAVTGISNKPFPVVVAHRAQCVAQANVTLQASPASAAYGQAVTLTADVAGGSGTVTFLDSGVSIGTGTLSGSGRATLTTSTLPVGTHTLTAFWPGTATVAPGTSAPVTVTVARASGATTSSLFVPIVLDVDNGSAHYVSEMALTNPGTNAVTATLTYTASLGSGSGTTTLVVPAGQQKVLPDALTTLRLGGLAIPQARTGAQGGTLALSFDNVTPGALPAATVRTFALTAAPQPVGAAGLAYGGAAPLTGAATLFGLRQDATDRSNVAVFNTGSEPVTLRVTAYSGTGNGASAVVAAAETLAPGAWKQYSGVLGAADFTNGWVVVERTSASGTFGTYGVINDNVTNDGSFVVPVTGAASGSTITLPVLVETPAFRSELVLANRGSAAATFALDYREALAPGLGAGGVVNVTVSPGEQKILPEAIRFLRTGGAAIGAENTASYAGAVRVAVTGASAGDVYVGARTASVSPAGGQFGLFTPGVASGDEATASAVLYGLRADAKNRSNVAVVNAGSAADGPVTLSLRTYDGNASGAAAGAPVSITLAPGEWRQLTTLLSGVSVSNGWVVATRTAGTAPWVAYGVINDGAGPGQRTGDGAYVPMFR